MELISPVLILVMLILATVIPFLPLYFLWRISGRLEETNELLRYMIEQQQGGDEGEEEAPALKPKKTKPAKGKG